MPNQLARERPGRHRPLGSFIVALVVLSIGLGPGNALAAGPAASAASEPGSSGWTPQGTGAVEPDGVAAPVQQGSSLGSGGGSQQVESTAPEAPAASPAATEYIEPAPSGYTESGSSEYAETAPPPVAEVESTPPVPVAPAPVEPAAKRIAEEPVDVGVGVPIARTTPPAAAGDAAPSAVPVPVPGAGKEAAEDPSAPIWLFALAALLVLAGVGRAIVVFFRRREPPAPDPDWRPEGEEWEAVLDQVRRERATGARRRRGGPPRKGEPDFAIAVLEEAGPAGEEPRRNGGKPTKIS